MRFHRGLAPILGLLLLAPLVPVASAAPPDDFFVTEATFPGVTWTDIHGTSPTNIWAVGVQSTTPVAAKRGVSGWGTLLTIPNSDVSNHATDVPQVWVDTTVAYAALSIDGVSSASKWDGSSWADFGLTLTGGKHEGIWGSMQSVVASGFRQSTANVRHYFDLATFGAFDCISSVAGDLGIAASNSFGFMTSIYQVGYFQNDFSYQLWRTSGTFTSCTAVGARTGTFTTPIRDLWGTSGTNLWAVGGNGRIVRFTPTISTQISPTTNNLDAIWGVSATNIWAVGASGTVIHYDGSSWTLQPTTTGVDYSGVWFNSATEGWAVRADGAIDKLQVNTGTPPNIAGLDIDVNAFRVSASQAQCLGDNVEIEAATDQTIGTGGVKTYIIKTDTNVVVDSRSSLVAGDFSSLNAQLFYARPSLPAGTYELVGTIDVMGALTPDKFFSWSLNVPGGTCKDANQDGSLTAIDPVNICRVSSNCLATGGSGELQFLDMSIQGSWTFLFWFAIILLGMWRGWPWVVAAGILAVPQTFGLSSWPLNFVWGIVALLIAMVIQYFAGGAKAIRKDSGVNSGDRPS